MTVCCWAARRTARAAGARGAAVPGHARHAGPRRTATGSRTARRARRCSRCTASKDRARRTTCAAWPTRRCAAGFNAILLNQRNCGGTEHLGPGLYHSGLIDDAAFVIRELARTDGIDRVVVAGYSLGGNLALRLAGTHAPHDLPTLKAVCAVSPVLELEAVRRARSSGGRTSSTSGTSCGT